MKEILVFAGTTEGRRLSEYLAASRIPHTLCVATEYGELVLKEDPFLKIHQGRMNQEEIKAFIQRGNFAAVVDATHPYADVITENIQAAMQGMDIPCLRLKRELDGEQVSESVRYFDTSEACARALEEVEGNILLTTGSKELSKYCSSETVKSRLYVRILPSVESISLCVEQGIPGKQMIAMQGPFTTEMNEAMIHQYGIACLVTKQSGRSGGYRQKIEAATKSGIPVFVIGHAQEENGYFFHEICRELEKLCGQAVKRNGILQITLAGIGMGHKNNLTKEVQDAIREADILLGAERMLAPYHPRLEKKPFYLAKQIIPYLREIQGKKICMEKCNVVVLFSGDSGFYSGCQSLFHTLQEEVNTGQLNASVRILPGISSVAYLAACMGEPYQDAAIYSMHGKPLHNLSRKIRREKKIYLLMSGVKDVNRLGTLLMEDDLTGCEVVIGYQLSYPEQQILRLSPGECCGRKEEGLYVCLVRNPNPVPGQLTHGIPDGAFIRDKVPMTKEEVREVSICKLHLHREAVVYDIGSGTGSIAVEMAALSDEIQVYAIEQKKEAVSLIAQNKEKFQLDNLTVVETRAPEGLSELPKATHALIGGSGGNLKEILQTLYHANPTMRVVMHAISMETICEMKEVISIYPIENEEMVQIQVSRTKKAGRYHLMQAENPIWICAFDFRKE